MTNPDSGIQGHARAAEWPRRLWHYCPRESFNAIIDSGELRLWEATWQDDPTELVYGERTALKPLLTRFTWKEIESRKVPFLSSAQRRPHVSCFTACGDSAAHWQRYADWGRGLAIGLELCSTGAIANFPQRLFVRGEQRVLQDWGLFWFPMVYDVRGQRAAARRAVQRLLDEDRGPEGDWNPEEKYWVDAFSMAMVFKSRVFEDENEYRLAFGHLTACRGHEWLGPASSEGRSYTPLKLRLGSQSILRAVRLGPGRDDVGSIRRRLADAKFSRVSVLRSRTPFRLPS